MTTKTDGKAGGATGRSGKMLAIAQWLPLVPGNGWQYLKTEAGREERVCNWVGQPEQRHGRETFPLINPFEPAAFHYTVYSFDRGALYLHALRRSDVELFVADEPMAVVPARIAPGEASRNHSRFTGLNETVEWLDSTFTGMEEELVVPAGRFAQTARLDITFQGSARTIQLQFWFVRGVGIAKAVRKVIWPDREPFQSKLELLGARLLGGQVSREFDGPLTLGEFDPRLLAWFQSRTLPTRQWK